MTTTTNQRARAPDSPTGVGVDNFNVAEAGSYVRSSANALRIQRSRGQKPGSLGFMVGKRLIYRRVDLDEYLAERAAGARR